MAFNLDDFQKGQKPTAEHFQQGVRGLRAIQRQLSIEDSDLIPNQCVLVKIKGNAIGGAKYDGQLVYATPDVGIDPATTLTAIEMGFTVTDTDCLVVNLAESASNTHYLTQTAAQTKMFLGYLWGFSTDGRQVVVIHQIDWEICTP
jgi:hypothetical protein